jgi:hypothetical protein
MEEQAARMAVVEEATRQTLLEGEQVIARRWTLAKEKEAATFAREEALEQREREMTRREAQDRTNEGRSTWAVRDAAINAREKALQWLGGRRKLASRAPPRVSKRRQP